MTISRRAVPGRVGATSTSFHCPTFPNPDDQPPGQERPLVVRVPPGHSGNDRLLFTVFVARQLGSAGFGVYAFLSAVLFIGNMPTTFGTDMLLMREIAARRDHSQRPAALLLQLGLSLLFILIAGADAPLFPNQSAISVMAVRIYTLSLIPLAFYTVFTTALRGTENMGLYALLGFASAALQLIGIAFVPAGGIRALVIWPFFVQVGDDGLADQLSRRSMPTAGNAPKAPPGPPPRHTAKPEWRSVSTNLSLIIFNASLHYLINLLNTLQEALRVLTGTAMELLFGIKLLTGAVAHPKTNITFRIHPSYVIPSHEWSFHGSFSSNSHL